MDRYPPEHPPEECDFYQGLRLVTRAYWDNSLDNAKALHVSDAADVDALLTRRRGSSSTRHALPSVWSPSRLDVKCNSLFVHTVVLRTATRL